MSDRFRKDPERYIPANGGDCPVTAAGSRGRQARRPPLGRALPGPAVPLRQRRRPAPLPRATPSDYAMVDVAEQGFCPHCLGETGLLVRGDPKFAVTRDGRRYWFPDPSHRDAFLAANPAVRIHVRRPARPTRLAAESGRDGRRNHETRIPRKDPEAVGIVPGRTPGVPGPSGESVFVVPSSRPRSLVGPIRECRRSPRKCDLVEPGSTCDG